MIESHLVVDEREEKLVREAMPSFKNCAFSRLHGFWDGDKCVGGAFLLDEYPHNGGVELDTNLPSLLSAASKCVNDLLEINGQIVGKVPLKNLEALKFDKSLGFVKMYEEDGFAYLILVRENWAYKDKYPLR
jgi:hypothetical protein